VATVLGRRFGPQGLGSRVEGDFGGRCVRKVDGCMTWMGLRDFDRVVSYG
jgi:hypothetical protein